MLIVNAYFLFRIIFYFHKTDSTSVPAKVSPPRLGGERRGVFSTRSPHRPCPIGLSLVKIHSIEGIFFNYNKIFMIFIVNTHIITFLLSVCNLSFN